MSHQFRDAPLLICHPRIWIHFWGIIPTFFAWIAFYTVIGIHILTVSGGMLILFGALQMLINFPFTLYLMPNGLGICRFGKYQEIAWHDIDFIVERGFLGDKRLIIGSHSFPKILSIEGFIQDRRWYPVHVLWRGNHTHYDEIQQILQSHLKDKYRYSYWM